MSSSNCGCGSNCNCGDNCNCNSMQIEFGEKTTAQVIIAGVAPLKMYEEMSFGSEGNGCKCGSNCSCGDSCDC